MSNQIICTDLQQAPGSSWSWISPHWSWWCTVLIMQDDNNQSCPISFLSVHVYPSLYCCLKVTVERFSFILSFFISALRAISFGGINMFRINDILGNKIIYNLFCPCLVLTGPIRGTWQLSSVFVAFLYCLSPLWGFGINNIDVWQLFSQQADRDATT